MGVAAFSSLGGFWTPPVLFGVPPYAAILLPPKEPPFCRYSALLGAAILLYPGGALFTGRPARRLARGLLTSNSVGRSPVPLTELSSPQ